MLRKQLFLLVSCNLVGCGLLLGGDDELPLRSPEIDAGIDTSSEDVAIDTAVDAVETSADVSTDAKAEADVATDATTAKLHPKGDFDGDGRADLFCRTNDNQIWVALSDATGTPSWQAKPWLTGWCGAPGVVAAADIDGDERADVYCNDIPSHALRTSLSALAPAPDGGSTYYFREGAGRDDLYCYANDVFSGDVDGDHDDDILCHNGTGIGEFAGYTWVNRSSSKGFPSGEEWLTKWCKESVTQFGVADFNKDGKDDVWCHSGEVGVGRTWIAYSSGFNFINTTMTPGDIDWVSDGFCTTVGSEMVVGDFTGDGYPDLLCHGPNRAGADTMFVGQTWVAVSVKGAFPKSEWKQWRSDWCTARDATIGFGDFDGDGMLDGYCHTNKGTTFVYAKTDRAFADGATLLGGCTEPGSQIGSGIALRLSTAIGG